MGELSASTVSGWKSYQSGLFLTNVILVLILIAVLWQATRQSTGRFIPEPGQSWEQIAFDTKTGQICVSLIASAPDDGKILASKGWPVCAELAKH